MIPLAPVVAVGARASVAIIVSVALTRPVSVSAADLLPGHRTTVWWDEVCDCRRVVVEPLVGTETGPLAPGQLFAEAP